MMAPNHAGLKVLFATGYSTESVALGGRLGADVPVVNKPFSRDELLRRVREVLDA